MKKLIKLTLAVVILLCIMFMEYRYIMQNIRPIIEENNTIYLEIFGQVDEYTNCEE